MTSPQFKRRIYLNAFDMFTVGHMSFGQWRNPADRTADKRRDLSYWTDIARLLERGDFNALFLADTNGWCDVYGGSAEPCVRNAIQYPMGDPVGPISAMAAVTKNLGFAITASTSFEKPYVLAKRLSTLDHLTKGRLGWNVVTSWKASGFEAIGIDPVPHDKRYEIADEYMRVLYKLWEGSWADDALIEDRKNGIYADFDRIRVIDHQGQHFRLHAPHILDPSPQRTPFIFQAGSSPPALRRNPRRGNLRRRPNPETIAPRVKGVRAKLVEVGRDPASVKVFASLTPIVGRTSAEAQAKHAQALQYASEEGGLVYWCANTAIDLSKLDMDEEVTRQMGDQTVDVQLQSLLENLAYPSEGEEAPVWTPRRIGKAVALGASGPVPVGTAEEVADEMKRWVQIADIDGFNIGHITVPGTWEDVVELLVPVLRKRGLYAPVGEEGTMRERMYGKGQSRLPDEHVGTRYKFDVYEQDAGKGV